MAVILASLRSASQQDLPAEVEALAKAGIDGLHLDIMDGHFVAERWGSPELVRKVAAATELLLDVHLICAEPERLVESFVEAGAHRVAVHVEAAGDIGARLAHIRTLGAKAGLVILPGTHPEALTGWLGEVDFVNPLGVDPTRGVGFQPTTFARIRSLVELRRERGLKFLIQADGGVWGGTHKDFIGAGADELVGGFPIFSRPMAEYGKAIDELR